MIRVRPYAAPDREFLESEFAADAPVIREEYHKVKRKEPEHPPE